ncbi:MAG TPA: hypothetical protein VFT50_17650 [Baekduia sp.]|nr:hypothetical protein [Baekduia sp.]
MEVSSQVGGVTPDGVREGDRAALQALVERRGPAVMAFCTRVCGPAAAARASSEAFARFRAAVRDALDLSAVDPEALLRGATRHAAAAMARTPTGPPPHGRLRSRGTQTCTHVPTMLAARANGALGEADLERLARHLDRCERCHALGEIFRSAEAAYAEPAVETLGSETSSMLVDAMLAVPDRQLGVAPEPLPGAPATEPQDGAYGHLPDLDDEVPVAEEAEAAPGQTAAAEVLDDGLPAGTPQAASVPVELAVPAGEEVPLAPEDDAEPEPEATVAIPSEAGAESAPPEIDATALLPVTHVDEPAHALEPEALAAEPVPAEPPAVAEHEVDLGETMEWDMVPVALQRRSYADGDAPLRAPSAARRRGRRGLGVVVKVVLPVVLVAAFAVAALAATGVLGSSEQPAPVVQHRVVPRVQKPVLTPLPVTVAADATASTATPGATAPTSSTTPSATTGTTTTDASTGTPADTATPTP